MTSKFTLKPNVLFLMDALGALVTAFLLIVVLKAFKEYIGMPEKILTILSLIAFLFFMYSLTCFFLLKKNWSPFLRIISIANLLYCCLTMALVIYYYPCLTILGLTYFFAEMIVIGCLVFIELKMVVQLSKTSW